MLVMREFHTWVQMTVVRNRRRSELREQDTEAEDESLIASATREFGEHEKVAQCSDEDAKRALRVRTCRGAAKVGSVQKDLCELCRVQRALQRASTALRFTGSRRGRSSALGAKPEWAAADGKKSD